MPSVDAGTWGSRERGTARPSLALPETNLTHHLVHHPLGMMPGYGPQGGVSLNAAIRIAPAKLIGDSARADGVSGSAKDN
jgi:hypothetical protein